MNAQVQSTLPDDTRAFILEAVEQGINDARGAAAAHEYAAVANAAEVIAKIPSLVRLATAEGLRRKTSRFRATLMSIGVDDCSKYLQTACTDLVSTSNVDRDTLTGASSIVWDHCEAAGLHVYVAHTKPEGEEFYRYTLDIAWSLPEPKDDGKKKKKWRWWPAVLG